MFLYALHCACKRTQVRFTNGAVRLWRVSTFITSGADQQPVVTFWQIRSDPQAVSALSMVVAQMHTNDYTDVRFIRETLGKIPNLVIVHAENLMTPEIGGNTHFCQIKSSVPDLPLDALNYVCNHDLCESQVIGTLPASMAEHYTETSVRPFAEFCSRQAGDSVARRSRGKSFALPNGPIDDIAVEDYAKQCLDPS